MRRLLGFLLQCLKGGLEALQGPCGGMGEEAAPHIDPVARKGKASCLGAEEWQVADRVMTTQGGVALPRDGAFDVSVTPRGWGNSQPIRPVQVKARQDEMITYISLGFLQVDWCAGMVGVPSMG